MLFLLVELYTIEHITSIIYLTCIVILSCQTTTATVLRRNGVVKQQKLRCRQDSNLRGKIPMDF